MTLKALGKSYMHMALRGCLGWKEQEQNNLLETEWLVGRDSSFSGWIMDEINLHHWVRTNNN